MGRGNHAAGLFIATNVASIAAATTILSPTFTPTIVEVWDTWDKLAVQVFATGGNASASGDVTATFLCSLDGVNWDSLPAVTAHVTMSGVAARCETAWIDVTNVHSIKLYSLQNADASYTATAVNVRWGKNYGG